MIFLCICMTCICNLQIKLIKDYLGRNHKKCSYLIEKLHVNTMCMHIKNINCIHAKYLTCHLMTLVEVFHMTDDCMSEFLNTLYVQICTWLHICLIHNILLVLIYFNLVIMSLVYFKILHRILSLYSLQSARLC